MTSVNEMPQELASALKGMWKSDDQAQLGEQAWLQVLIGEDDVEMFLEFIDEDEQEELGVDESIVASVFNMVLDARRKQVAQLTEDERTTSLARAFDEPEIQGIIARQNISCCGTCAPG